MNDIVAFDVETPNSNNDRICSIGLTFIRNGEVAETTSYLINPETCFDDVNIQIHGIRPSDVSSAPTFPEVWEQIGGYLRSNLVIAHNATFDLCVLRKALQAYGISEAMLCYVCTLQMARKVLPGLPDYKLSTICESANIPLVHHDAGSDSRACAELFQIFSDSSIPFDSFIRSFDLSKIDTPRTQRTAVGSQSQSLLVLKGILTGVTCDGVLSESEVLGLRQWLNDNLHLAGNFPFDKVYKVVSDSLSDGILEPEELADMLNLFRQISDPVGSSCPACRNISLTGKNICLTGEFDRGSRSDIEDCLAAFGATCQKNPNRTTHYLIVGGQGSSAWCAGNYGTKVKKALEMQEKGSAIEIIRETDFFAALEGKKDGAIL